MATTRRLVAIFAADVAGYSRLMGADEEDTHTRLSQHFDQLIVPKIRQHHGQVVKNTGDGVLAEFASVVDAVRSATEIQRGMIDRDLEVSDDRRIKFRIGVNLGDVIVERGDIFGDGVNVAARLQTLAEPGGVCISRTVRDQIRDKFAFRFEDVGEQSVKNIARPIRVYSLTPDTIATLPKTQVSASSPATKPVQRLSIAALTLISILVGAGALWWLTASLKAPSSEVTASANQTIQAPKRLSIVVLPFTNLSNDPDQQYFADGITEDLTTDLSRIAHSLVISSNTAFTYKDKPVNAKQIGRELDVRYVLEGSVQRSGNQVRVNAQLIDAEADTHVWAERFERDISDLFALQNEITARLAIALDLALLGAEAARPTNNPDAMDYILRGRAVFNQRQSRESLEESISLFERALALDPHSAEAQAYLAGAFVNRVLFEMTEAPTADIARAEPLIEQALAASPGSLAAHYVKGKLLRLQGRPEAAMREFEMILSSDPNSVSAIFQLGWCKMMTGSIDEAIPLVEQDIRLSPRDPSLSSYYWRTGAIHLLQSRTDEAIVWFEKGRSANPRIPALHAMLASAYALKGEAERATTELTEARRLSERYSSMARVKAAGYAGSPNYWGVPKVRALFEATYFAGLRKAGVPEQ